MRLDAFFRRIESHFCITSIWLTQTVSSVSDGAGAPTGSNMTNYSYDANGNQTSVTVHIKDNWKYMSSVVEFVKDGASCTDDVAKLF